VQFQQWELAREIQITEDRRTSDIAAKCRLNGAVAMSRLNSPCPRPTESDGRIPAEDRTDDLLNFDIQDFDDTGIELPAVLETPDRLIARLSPASQQSRSLPRDAHSQDGELFPQFAMGNNHRDDHTALNSTENRLWSIVARAYADVRCDRSIDYVVVDPESNLLFLQRCWELGAPASPFELNWVLMNSRKDGKLSGLARAKSFSIPKGQLDLFAFAAEIAMRCVQDRIYFEEQRDVSIDHVLCDPHLLEEFDDFARRLAPGYNAREYRWAVITLRKARRSLHPPIKLPRLRLFGLLEDVKARALPAGAGTYWIQADESSIFTGVATSLRRQVESLIDQLGIRVVPEWIKGGPKVKMQLYICEEDTHQAAEVVRARVLAKSGSLLNFRYGSFFGAQAA
jgi:hypothetical protein